MTSNRFWIPSDLPSPDGLTVLQVELPEGVVLEIAVALAGTTEPVVVLMPTLGARPRLPLAAPYRQTDDTEPEWSLLN